VFSISGLGFNSSLVRLGVPIDLYDLDILEFQFQLGAIGSWSLKDAVFTEDSFNSSLVRLGEQR